MKTHARLLAFALALGAPLAFASDATSAEPTQETFVIQGLHCPPCTSTVERSLVGIKGVQSAKVDWRTKNAWITLDESVISAQQVAQTIAATPHMMGRGMHYAASLALKVPALKDNAAAAKVKA